MNRTDFKVAVEYTAPICEEINMMPCGGYLQAISSVPEDDFGEY